MAKFKACPFCGCSVPPAVQGNGIGDNWLECTECGASTRLREDGAGSEKDWNRRAARATAEQRDSVIEEWIEETCAAYCIPKPFAIIEAISALKSQQDAAVESQRSGDGS
jgi:hypothetical protein